MRKILILTLTVFFALSAAAYAADGKVGVIKINKIVSECKPGLQAQEKLKADFDKQGKELERMKNDIAKMRDDLQKQGMMLSLDARQDKELEYKRNVRDFQDMTQAFQRKFSAAKNELLQPIFKAVATAVRDYGKRNGYAVIFDTESRFNDIMYYDEAIDVTADIIKEVNKNWK